MLRSSRSPPAVASRASLDRVRVSSGSSSSRPRSRTRTPCARSSAVSLRIARLEQAEQARDLVVGAGPVLAAEGVQRQRPGRRGGPRDGGGSRIASTPAAWPSSSGRSRARAQRRLPSMMIATWRGRSSGGSSGSPRRPVGGSDGRPPAAPARGRSAVRRSDGPAARGPLDLEDLLLLRRADRSTSAMWRSVSSGALDLAVRLVGPDVAVALLLLERGRWRRGGCCGSRRAPLPCACGRLDEVLATLLGQRRDVQPDDRAVDVGHEPDVALHDRLLDRAEDAAIPGLDHDLVRLGDADAGELVERRLGAVVVDVQALDEARSRRGRSAGPGSRAPWPRPRGPSCARPRTRISVLIR